ncbi:MAG: HPr(Ser) kinase/phosphatase [Pyrinomonadaceae bacterium]
MKEPKISILDFIEKVPPELPVEILAGAEGLKKRQIISARTQKLGLALAGFAHYIHSGRVQIVGQSEISYLYQLDREKRIHALRNLELDKICCILITKNLEPPPELIQIAEEAALPVLRTGLLSSVAIGSLTNLLLEILAPQKTIHGVLLGMYGIGVLILGNSGIGKSECALDLIIRGHNLISDDAVIIKRIGSKIQGSAPELTYEHLEIRGLGIINVREIFGVTSVGKQKKQIDLCIELKKWSEIEAVERFGLETEVEDFLGVNITKFVLPVSSGRTTSTLVETAIRVHLSRLNGSNVAKRLIERHTEMLGAAGS